MHHFDVVCVSLYTTSSLALDKNHAKKFLVIFMSLLLISSLTLKVPPGVMTVLHLPNKRARSRTHTRTHNGHSTGKSTAHTHIGTATHQILHCIHTHLEQL